MAKTLNEWESLQLYSEEMEYTSDSFSVYYDYVDEQIFKLKIIGQVDETTVKKY